MKRLLAVLVIIVLVLIFYWSVFENFINYSPDQILERASDPMKYKYVGRVKDKWGMDPKDYFLENKTYYNTSLIPLMKDDRRFGSVVNLDDMRKYYPSSLLSIREINSVPTPQYTYFTVNDSPPVHAERAMLAQDI